MYTIQVWSKNKISRILVLYKEKCRKKKIYSITTRAKNYFHCCFVFLIEIKLDKLHKYRNNLIYFVSLLQDFFLFMNKFKYIYILPNYTNKKHFDLKYESFSYYLSVNDPCLCYHSEDPF